MGLWQWTVISVGSEGAGRASLEDESDLGRAELAEKVGPTVIMGMGTSPRRRQGRRVLDVGPDLCSQSLWVRQTQDRNVTGMGTLNA